jgi:hypothetical protein
MPAYFRKRSQRRQKKARLSLFEAVFFQPFKLALQLLFCFEVRALGGGLVNSTPE